VTPGHWPSGLRRLCRLFLRCSTRQRRCCATAPDRTSRLVVPQSSIHRLDCEIKHPASGVPPLAGNLHIKITDVQLSLVKFKSLKLRNIDIKINSNTDSKIKSKKIKLKVNCLWWMGNLNNRCWYNTVD
jgi:hypothetical protein